MATPGIPSRWKEYFRTLLDGNDPEQNSDIQLLEGEVRNAIKKLRHSKVPGRDGLPGVLFKYAQYIRKVMS